MLKTKNDTPPVKKDTCKHNIPLFQSCDKCKRQMAGPVDPFRKNEEKDWWEKDYQESFAIHEETDCGTYGMSEEGHKMLKSLIRKVLRKEHTLINEKTAKLVQESYHTGFQAALKQIGEATKVDFLHPDKAMQQLLQKAFNDGYEKALDERKGEV